MKMRSCLAAAAALSMLAADPAAAKALSVTAVVDWNQPEATVAAVAERLCGVLDGQAGQVIDLDLTIIARVSSESAESAPDYNVSVLTSASPGSAPLRCENSWERLTVEGAFRVGFNPAYNHLLLQILHTGPLVAPQITVACESRGSDSQPAFHVRGRYVVSTISVPTAVDIQLRPVLGPPE